MNAAQFTPGFVYHVYPLGALGAEKWNVGGLQAQRRLSTFSQWIPHWKALGIDTILFGPLFEAESHGYDIRDPQKVDTRLGSNEDLRCLIDTLHDQGFRVLFDGVFNHTGRSFQVFQQLIRDGGHSDLARWYKNLKPGTSGPDGTPFSYQGWNGHASLPELNLRDPLVKTYLKDVVTQWIEEFRIDGLRLDAADVLDFEFMNELSTHCRNIRPDFWIMGEVIHGDYNRWVDQAGLNSVTNYELYKALWSSLNDGNFFELTWTLNRHFGPSGLCRHFTPLSFLDNHDVSRITSVVKDPQHLPLLWELMFFLPGVPSLYYGSEWDWTGVKGQGDDWNLRPACHPAHQFQQPSRVEHIRALTDFRQTRPALRRGSLEVVTNTHHQLAFLRAHGDDMLLVLVNSAPEPVSWVLPREFSSSSRVWGQGTLEPRGGSTQTHLPGRSISIFQL